MLRAALTAFTVCATAAIAETPDLQRIVDTHILPGYRDLATQTATLSETAASDCAPESETLRTAYNQAFDAWVRVSHLRFGPSETSDRAFALAFWPDSRGVTPKTLATLIRDEDQVIETLEDFQTVSVAARGFYALEFLIYDDAFSEQGSADYRCALIGTLSEDIANNSADILDDWENGYGALIQGAGANDTYRSEAEAAQQLFTALSTGLEFTADVRLGRPLGTFDRPRPRRAEARRSGRSLRHIVLSLEATRDLADLLSVSDAKLDSAFADALNRAETLNDPIFSGVAEPIGRLRVEALQQSVTDIRQIVAEGLGPRLGIAAGFNSLDGD